MANFDEHLGVGAGAGCLIYLLTLKPGEKLEHRKLLGSAITGAFGGVASDLIEPSTNGPNHRGFCHSEEFGIAASASLLNIQQNSNLSENTRLYGTTTIAGILSHLVLDSSTPKGLRRYLR